MTHKLSQHLPMKIMLAPMQGVVDCYMRKILTELGGYDSCVTEFIRVVDHLLPEKVFYRYCPELTNNGKTSSGTPVLIQLLGSDPSAMAENACRAAELGALGIDLNFGCPSKCVNNSHGGAYLLQSPETIYRIVNTVRQAMPPEIPVSAKIRLGYETTDLALDNALAVESAGASFITVHARTKADRYKAPARWEWLAHINQALSIPMINNGDINNIDDFKQCTEISGCDDIMIGRGAVACPNLARQIKHYHASKIIMRRMAWEDVNFLLMEMAIAMKESVKGRFIVARIKQWLVMLKQEYSEAQTCFDNIRHLKDYPDLMRVISPNDTH